MWRNAAKKLSCRRLALNEADFEGHPLWGKVTQLGDAKGALKAALIDVVTADSEVSAFLEETLHKPLTPTDAEVPPDSARQCLPYLCQEDPQILP